MTLLLDLFARLMDHVARPLPTLLMALLPLVIAVAGLACLSARSDDRIRAIVQVISALLLTLWLLLPWHPTEPEVITMNRIMTLFAYGYVLQDWLREAWRSGLIPAWAHGMVLLWLLACGGALILAPAAI
jgi:hypothetical protein